MKKVNDDVQLEGQMNIFDFIPDPNKKPEPIHWGPVFEYLRYGPHTVVPEARETVKKALNEHGIPEGLHVEKWHKFPCENCEYSKGGICYSGGHTCHYEYGILICDGFKQTIMACKEGRKPCPHSEHACNKENLWEVADSLDDIICPHTCCRECSVKCCGARCNGSCEPVEQCADNVPQRAETYKEKNREKPMKNLKRHKDRILGIEHTCKI